jgi:rubrerythrin
MSKRLERKYWRERNKKNPLRNVGYAALVYPKRRKKGKIIVRHCSKCGEIFSTTAKESVCPSCAK